MRILTKGLLALAVSAFLFGCQKQVQTPADERFESDAITVPTSIDMGQVEECGEPLVMPLVSLLPDMTERHMGTVTIVSDEEFTYLTLTADAGRVLTKIKFNYDDRDQILFDLRDQWRWTACGGPFVYDAFYQFTPRAGVTTMTLKVANSEFIDKCIYFALNVTTYLANGTDQLCGYPDPENAEEVGSQPHQRIFKYCLPECPPDGECGPGRTQTPGGWGAVPKGGNPGTYLHTNFESIFGTLVVGCESGNTITLTTAQAITDLLPTGGEAAVLSASYTDPASIKNVLVGHVVALTLSVGFDEADETFGSGDLNLGDMEIGSGTFAGMTVNEFLALANAVLGGCNTDYTAKQIQETIEDINENYVDGKVDNGFLVCPE